MTNRTLTVLFTDIVRSTELLDGLGPSPGERLRRAHFAALHEQVERRGGRVVKTLGDGVMASFDSAGGAIDASIAIQQATATTLQPEEPTAVSVRIGISSGDVCVDDGADCFGSPVVEASRLCTHAQGGQVLLAQSTRLLISGCRPLREHASLNLKGLPRSTTTWEAVWTPAQPIPVRAVLADDTLLVREGISRVLSAHGIEVLAEAGNPDELLRVVAESRPDIAIVDVRMPPTRTFEGIEAAERIIARHPATAILLLSQDVQPHHAARLLETRTAGLGYLLKERVIDTRAFADTVRRVSAGEIAFEPTITQNEGPSTSAVDPIDGGTAA